ncbi:MAG: MCE family protein [Actinomycetota bacterium]|nr:MCE family protein [Actinomycetota bacterium]
MITSRTKKQLLAFVILTLVGVSFVGARYARLDKLFYATSYNVNAHFAQSGGIFTGAEVTYRGVQVGQVSNMLLTRDGVDVVLEINKGQSHIPADTMALVANKSAVGEQYVELDPNTNKGPFLRNGSVIDTKFTRTPVSTVELLTNLDNLVNSVPRGDLRTVVSEFGAGFKGAGPTLGRIIDTSGSFIQTANQNFDVTTALIRDSRTVLQTQVDKASAIRSFARDLSLFSGTLAAHDQDLRTLIDNGSATATELRTFLQQNQVQLGQLINNLVTNGEVTIKHLNGIRQILVLYPYVVAGGFTVAAKGSGGYDAHFGLILNNNPPVCNHGYEGTDRRTPDQRGNRPMYVKAHCAEPASQSNARGAQNAPNGRTGVNYRPAPATPGPPVATYDLQRRSLTWADQSRASSSPRVVYTGGAAQLFGKADSWKWLLLSPALGSGE